MLAVVVAATLATLALSSYSSYMEKAKVAKAEADLTWIQSRIALYQTTNSQLPTSLATIGEASVRDPWGHPYQYLDFTGLQSTAFPLVIDFSFTKEIEDRLLAPLPVGMVAVEKVVFASMRALLAALVMLPIGVWVLGSIPWPASGVPLFLTVLVLGCLVGSCLGMIMGTAVPPNRINVMFALILTPLLFTGASQYPWASLDDLRWFQVVTALNPLTYVSEGMRAALVPEVPHIRPWVSVLVLVLTIVVSLAVGIRLFLRRAVD